MEDEIGCNCENAYGIVLRNSVVLWRIEIGSKLDQLDVIWWLIFKSNYCCVFEFEFEFGV